MILKENTGENLVFTESVLGAVAKMCYKHMDNKNLTAKDLVDALSSMPFTAHDTENMTSHKILIE